MSANILSVGSIPSPKTALAAILGLALCATTAYGADKVTFLTSWFAQAEHGGANENPAQGMGSGAG
jgi:NitT/TauT family transport system substrate-binding protein